MRDSVVLLYCVALTACAATSPPVPTRSTVRDPRRGTDSAIAVALERDGVHVSVGRATVYFPRDSFVAARMEAMAARYDSTITAVASLVPPNTDWLEWSEHRVTYFVAPGSLISHTATAGHVPGVNGPVVFMAAWRVRSDSAPTIHETAHAVLAVRAPLDSTSDSATLARMRSMRAQWIEEGLANYVALRLAPMLGNTEWNPLESERPTDPDRACAAYLRGNNAHPTLDYVGRPGTPPNIFTNRDGVARPFYTCATSYVKFLVARLGFATVAAMRRAVDLREPLEAAAGQSSESLRSAWVESLPKPDPSPT